jgi:PAS domain S-box-containing protein
LAISSSPGLTPPRSVPLAEVAPPGLATVAARKTAESARWLAALVENSSDSIVGVHDRGILQSWNAGAQRLFGYTAAEMLGRTGDALIPAGWTDELEEVLGQDEQFIDSFRFETERVRSG